MVHPLPTVIRILLAGDVMLGRGIDQILPYHVNPQLHEEVISDAREYVNFGILRNGELPQPRNFSYVWGEALKVIKKMKPDASLFNLETTITQSEDFIQGQSIHYRMHPGNIEVLKNVNVSCCNLANNHICDWGVVGVNETLGSLRSAGIKYTGAGMHMEEAMRPAVLRLNSAPGRRVLVFGMGHESAGIPPSWAAKPEFPGVHYLLLNNTKGLKALIRKWKRKGDIVVLSIHWGPNFGWDVPKGFRMFGRDMIDSGLVDMIHGHSSHHIKGMEVYKGKLIIYGAGDLISDYEGIPGEEWETYRSDLGFLYFADLEINTGKLFRLYVFPTKLKKFSVTRAVGGDLVWLRNTMRQQRRKFKNHRELFRLIHEI